MNGDARIRLARWAEERRASRGVGTAEPTAAVPQTAVTAAAKRRR